MAERESAADLLVEKLHTLALDNPMASRLMLRVMEADDPDAEAERVIAEITALGRGIVAVLSPVVETITRFAGWLVETVGPVIESWKADGIDAAERHANDAGTDG